MNGNLHAFGYSSGLSKPTRRRARRVSNPVVGERRRDFPADTRELVKLLVSTEARQRERIACNLHDEVGQLQVLQQLKLGELRRSVQGDAARLAGELAELMSATVAATRAATFDIGCPTWRGGLRLALEDLAQALRARGVVAVELEHAPVEVVLPELQLAIVHRVVRELCHNAQKHAGAPRLRLSSAIEGDRLRVSVQDEGGGMPFEIPTAWKADRRGGFGLASAQAQMHAIDGELQLRFVRGQGTCASVVLPLPPASAA